MKKLLASIILISVLITSFGTLIAFAKNSKKIYTDEATPAIDVQIYREILNITNDDLKNIETMKPEDYDLMFDEYNLKKTKGHRDLIITERIPEKKGKGINVHLLSSFGGAELKDNQERPREIVEPFRDALIISGIKNYNVIVCVPEGNNIDVRTLAKTIMHINNELKGDKLKKERIEAALKFYDHVTTKNKFERSQTFYHDVLNFKAGKDDIQQISETKNKKDYKKNKKSNKKEAKIENKGFDKIIKKKYPKIFQQFNKNEFKDFVKVRNKILNKKWLDKDQKKFNKKTLGMLKHQVTSFNTGMRQISYKVE